MLVIALKGLTGMTVKLRLLAFFHSMTNVSSSSISSSSSSVSSSPSSLPSYNNDKLINKNKTLHDSNHHHCHYCHIVHNLHHHHCLHHQCCHHYHHCHHHCHHHYHHPYYHHYWHCSLDLEVLEVGLGYCVWPYWTLMKSTFFQSLLTHLFIGQTYLLTLGWFAPDISDIILLADELPRSLTQSGVSLPYSWKEKWQSVSSSPPQTTAATTATTTIIIILQQKFTSYHNQIFIMIVIIIIIIFNIELTSSAPTRLGILFDIGSSK